MASLGMSIFDGLGHLYRKTPGKHFRIGVFLFFALMGWVL